MMKLDLHVHSRHSEDTILPVSHIIAQASRSGIQGLAITDHNTVKGGVRGARMARDKGCQLLVIPGIEITTSSGHVLAIGVDEDVTPGMSVVETIEAVEALGGIAVASHPYRMWNGIGEEEVRRAGFKAIEAWNSMSYRSHNQRARGLARECGIGMTGGSDAHELDRIGMGYTDFINPVETVDDVVSEIASGNTVGDGCYRTLRDTTRYILRGIRLWATHGMIRI